MLQRLAIAFLAASLFTLTNSDFARAADAPAADAPKAEAPAADAPKADAPKADAPKAEEAPAVDPYAIPEGASNEELLKFIKGLAKVKSKSSKAKDQLTHMRKSASAAVDAAEKILASDAGGEIRLSAVDAEIKALASLHGLDRKKSEEQFASLEERIKSDKEPKIVGRSRWIDFQLRVYKTSGKDAKGALTLISEIPAVLADAPDESAPVMIASSAASQLEEDGAIDPAAFKAYRDIAAALTKIGSTDAVKGAERIEGVIRKLELLGKPIAITGTLLSGETFDQSKLKGKVVLVDFWATWCGPCIAEVPNVKKCYQQYHDKGFEVIGISLDTDRARLEKYLKDKEIPWPILFEAKEGDQGWKAPMATKYGVAAIPSMFFVDANGNVISLSARGKKLNEILEKHLGPAPPPEPGSETEPAKEEPVKDDAAKDAPAKEAPPK